MLAVKQSKHIAINIFQSSLFIGHIVKQYSRQERSQEYLYIIRPVKQYSLVVFCAQT